MTMRAPKSGFRMPKRLSMGNEFDSEFMNSLDLEKSLPYVDYSTGVNNRLIERDPITGLGSLPREINCLEGSQLKRYTQPSNSEQPRNPILLQGDLGEEFNCLYTTKELHCKGRENRNIITLEGELGEELDPIRPHGGRPRNVIKNSLNRDPISGTGDFGREWDPIYKYQGRMMIKRPTQVKRDPITHDVPLENMGEAPPKNGKLFTKKVVTNPIVSEEKQSGQPHTGLRMRRHSIGAASYDPIKHDEEQSQSATKAKCGLKFFPDKGDHTNPITHVSNDASQNGLSNNHQNAGPAQQKILKSKRVIHKTEVADIRNPISGENINSSEIAVLWVRPENYHFRQPGQAKEAPVKKKN